MLIDEGLEILDEPEALRLLANSEAAARSRSRVAGDLPYNYRLVDGSVVFWSAPGSKLSAAASGAVVAFEVDDYNLADRSGWSVLVVGPSEVVEDRDVVFKALAAGAVRRRATASDRPRRADVRVRPADRARASR